MNGHFKRALALLPILFLSVSTGFAQRVKPKPKPTPKPPPQTQPAARSQTYSFDAAQSQIHIILTQEGLLARRTPTNTVATKSFTGRIDLPKDETRATVTVDAQSASTTNIDAGMGDFERKEFQAVLHNSVLEIEKFPSIKFNSVSVADILRSGDNRSFTLNGDLTLHGVTRRVSFPVKATIAAGQLQAAGEAKLKQSDFGMKPFEKGMGLIKIADELKITFNVVAKAQ